MMRLLPFILLIWLSGCSNQPHHSQSQTWLDRQTAINLPAPGLDVPMQRHQLLSVVLSDGRYSFQALLQVDEEQLELLALTPTGIRLFSLRYDAAGIHTEQQLSSNHLPPPAQVLADVMLAYWPVAAWEVVLPQDWVLQDQPLQRHLLDAQGRPVVEIEYRMEKNQREPYRLTQQAFDYQLHLRNLD
jgi:hypothetical protein